MGADKDQQSGSSRCKVLDFELLDASGKTAFTGKAELAKADGAEDQICIHEKQDYTKSMVYGQGNEGKSQGSNSWVQTWLLNYGPFKKMVPNWYDWPVNEQYIDFGTLALHNENCFFQTSVPAACYWFWLHTRPSR